MNSMLKQASKHVDFATIMKYAEVTNDYNPAHVDKEFADQSPMGGIIAHGTMSVNLIWQALKNTLGIEALGRTSLHIRFVRPVRIDDTVSGGGSLQANSSNVYDVWVRNQKGEDVIVGIATLKT
ncbi:MAG: MaoC family dehydratase [Comamonadaceae bacterium]|nr:MaoC family dehydratase [Comamonadaceae bacterium]